MSKKIIALVAAGFALLAALLKPWLNEVESPLLLTQPHLEPGPWFCYYLGDYLVAHPGENIVRSHPVEIGDGSFIWATTTPEWDRGWFENRGWEFPAKWMPYEELRGLPIEMNLMGHG